MGSAVHQKLLAIAVPVMLLALAASSLHADNAHADTALQQGRVGEARSLLQASLRQQPVDSEAHQLLCRVYYAQDMGDEAIRECETAAVQAPSDSENQMWLGRAYGLKASHTNIIAAYRLAKKVHAAFERAVQLDDGNFQAMNDLGDYFVQAPGVVGGGLDKAQALADRMERASPRRRIGCAASSRRKKTIWPVPKQSSRQPLQPDTPPMLISISRASMAGSTGWIEAVAMVHTAIAADQAKDAVLVDAAAILTDVKRSPYLAERLLRQYLASPAKSDAAPAFKVHLQLGKLLAKDGDLAGQQAEVCGCTGAGPRLQTRAKHSGGQVTTPLRNQARVAAKQARYHEQ